MKSVRSLLLMATLWGLTASAQDSLHVRRLGGITVSGWLSDATQYLAVQDTLLLVCATEGGLQIYDLADVRHPVELSNVSYLTAGAAIAGHYAYVNAATWFHVYDISEPQAPDSIGSCILGWPWYRGATVAANHVYVCDLMGGVRIVDVTNPASPSPAGQSEGSGTNDVKVAGDYAYAAAIDGLNIIDVSNITEPEIVGWWWDGYTTSVSVDLAEHYAYVANREGIEIVDVSIPTAPLAVHFVDTPNLALAVDVESHYAFVANGDAGLRVYDVADPTSPELVGFYTTSAGARSVVIHGCIACVAENDAIGLYDVSYFVRCGTPRAPGDVVIQYLPEPQAMRLDWSPVYLDTSRLPIVLDQFMIYRATRLELEDWQCVGSPTPPDTTVFLDSAATGVRGFYQVRAVTE